MSFDAIQRSFAAGELAPALAGRADVTKYATGLRTCRNFIVQRYGGVTNRAGTEFICKVRNSSKASRVVPFIFNEEQTYVLEFSEQKIRIIQNGALLTTSTLNITNITAANPPVVTSVAHGLSDGQSVLIENVTGMTQPNGQVFIVDSATTDDFEIVNADGSFPQGISWDAYVSGGTAKVVLEVDTPYAEADLFRLQFAQSADVLTITHRDYGPRELRREAATTWTLEEIRWEPNIAAPTGVTASVGGAGTRSYDYQVVAISTNNSEESLPGSVTSSAVNITNIVTESYTTRTLVNYGGRGGSPTYTTRTYYRLKVTATSHGLNTGDMALFEDVLGMTEINGQRYRVDRIDANNFYVRSPSNVNQWSAYTSGGTVTPTNKTLGSCAVPTTAAPNVITWTAVENAFEYHVFRSDSNSGVYGFIGVSRSTSFSDDNVLPDTSDTPRVQRNPFAGERNQPGAVGYFQQRRLYGSTSSAPETVWCSAIGDYNNLATRSPITDKDAFSFGMVGGRVHEVRHIVDIGQLVILTSGGEWIAQGSSEGALTPTDINLRQYGHNGATYIQPVIITNTMLYVQARGSIVRDFRYELQADGYTGRDLTIFSPHLFDGYTIVDWAYQEIPHSVVWAVRNDGALLGLTYVRDHEVWGWHRHDTAGDFESACVVPEGEEDALYLVVSRTVNSATERYIERMHSRVVGEDSVDADAFFVDCGYTYDGRHTGSTLMNVNGTGWTVDDTQTLTASASTFTSADVGKAVRLRKVSSGSVVRLTITAYTDATHVTVRPNKTIPTDLRNQSIVDWAMGVTKITGLWWLEGENVAILADGNVVSDGAEDPLYTVTDGEITLQDHAFIAHVGQPFTADIETLDLDNPDGETLLAKKKIISKVTLLLDDSRGGHAGPDEDHLTEFKQRQSEDWDEPVVLHTGPEEIRIQANWNQNGRIFVRQTDPLPITILAAVPTIQLGGSG